MGDSFLSELTERFSIPGVLTFRKAPGGLVYAAVQNDSAAANVFLHGAQVTSYIPEGQEPVLFLSELNRYEEGRAIRGGIPLSWPWFADHTTDASKPAHGFARTTEWIVKKTGLLPGGGAGITLGLTDNRATRGFWDHSFELELDITIGETLDLALKMRNTGDERFSITSAFHTYYHVSAVGDITILGLEDADYIDKVDGFKVKTQDGPVRIRGETDRIYMHTEKGCILSDPGYGRNMRIRKSGSGSTVVWNPWGEKARSMADLGDEDYLDFVCVEIANAGDDVIQIPPRGEHRLGLTVMVEEM